MPVDIEHLKQERNFGAITEALADEDPAVRCAAAQAIGELGLFSAREELTGLLNDKSAEVRLAAVQALGKVADWHTLKKLDAMRHDADGRVREAASHTLAVARREWLQVRLAKYRYYLVGALIILVALGVLYWRSQPIATLEYAGEIWELQHVIRTNHYGTGANKIEASVGEDLLVLEFKAAPSTSIDLRDGVIVMDSRRTTYTIVRVSYLNLDDAGRPQKTILIYRVPEAARDFTLHFFDSPAIELGQ